MSADHLHVVGYDDVPDEVLFAGGEDYDQPTGAEGEPVHMNGFGAQPNDPAVEHDNSDDGPLDPEIPGAFDDAHVAEALAGHLRGCWLYVATWGRWLQWDGTRWASDDIEAVHEEARRWVIELGTTLFRIGASSDDLRRCAGYRNRTRLDAVLTMARRIDGISARSEDFDQDPDVLNVANGTVDLRTGDLHPHDPAQRLTRNTKVGYVPGAYHEDVGELLRVVDREVVPWLARTIGYAATGHTNEDVVLVFDGNGANGKSTLLEGVGATLGDYAGAVSPQLVMRSAHEVHPTIKADLMGKRLVWISETEEGGAFRMEQVKALTGGDQISARFMRGDYFTFTPTHALVIATNHRPAVNSTEHAAWRRLRLVPFPFTYRSAEQAGAGDRIGDPKLRHRLTHNRAQREALLAWIVEGAVSWNAHGIGTCPTIDEASTKWRQAEDVVLRFITECIDLDPTCHTSGRDLYTAYKDWCHAEGRNPKSGKNFAHEFLEHEDVQAANVTKTTPQGSARYEGVSVRGVPEF